MSEYAVPRFFSGMILGTDGHIADGTNEYPMPRSAIETYAYIGSPCGAKVMIRCEVNTKDEPTIIQRVAFPTLSTRAPKRGVKRMVKKGIIARSTVAMSRSTPKSGRRMDTPNFLNLITVQ